MTENRIEKEDLPEWRERRIEARKWIADMKEQNEQRALDDELFNDACRKEGIRIFSYISVG